MDRRSRSFKILTLAQQPTSVLNERRNVENENYFIEATEVDLQSAIVALTEEIEITNQLFEQEGAGNDLSPSLINNAIHETEQTEDNHFVAEEPANLLEQVKNTANYTRRKDEEKMSHNPEEVDNNSTDPTYQMDTSEDENDPNIANVRKRKKKRLSDPTSWKYNINKKNREKGTVYMGRKENKFDVMKNERAMKERCQCVHKLTKMGNEMSIQCYKLTNEDRKSIFFKFWYLSWAEKKRYVSARVYKKSTKRARNRNDPEVSQRTSSYTYLLRTTKEQIRVCKVMFCNTLGVSIRTISEWVKNELTSPAKNDQDQHTTTSAEKRHDRFKQEKIKLKRFLDYLPKLESHYCRKSSTKLYLEPLFKAKSEVYALYRDWCVEEKINPLCSATFSNTFEDLNLSLFMPKKDECDVCVGYKTKNVEETVYMEHIAKKEEARAAKANDKNSKNRVFTMDLQSVLLCPRSNVSALYYRTKLIVHNFTIFDMHSKDGYCYLWHEGEGELGANCFASIISNFLINEVIPQLEPTQQIILFSDGCSAQNRNCTLSNALLNLAIEKQVCIIQKYLEKGHTQMECDSMHSTIERKLRRRTINVPADYVSLCKLARKNPKPYHVSYLDHTFFKDYSKLNLIKSIRPGYKVGDPTVNNLRALKYNSDGQIEFKIKHSEEYEVMPMRLKKNLNKGVPNNSLPALYSEPLKIKNEKFEHLMFLKKSLEKDYHNFYDNLRHE
ncbi:hypothetical protein PPYR_13376 [Photinus pyralis]|uniref:Uncharacterized protein n=2 Tax=Photinus pyralis TaxID=7054 RepID=A0A5N4A8U9_PHOPY|nr:uncharacterized protein LOC116178930 [Photinus pyralis]KAB0793756.1 hypothetical protein PPYR_13376 [Photinus pyralis]